MFAIARPQFWALFFREFRCHNCGSHEGYESRPRNFFERYLLEPIAFRPARCGDCYRRSWRPLRVPLLPRMDAMRFDAERMVATARAADRGESRKETHKQAEDQQRIA